MRPLYQHTRRFYAWAWSRVAVPKIFTIAMCSIYLMLLIGWIPGLVYPPGSLEGAVGTVSMYMIAALIIIGAVTGIPSALVGQFRVERWSVIAVAAGIAMYVFIVHTLHWTQEGNRLPQAQTIASLLVVFAVRLHHVWRRPVGSDEEIIVHTEGDSRPDDS